MRHANRHSHQCSPPAKNSCINPWLSCDGIVVEAARLLEVTNVAPIRENSENCYRIARNFRGLKLFVVFADQWRTSNFILQNFTFRNFWLHIRCSRAWRGCLVPSSISFACMHGRCCVVGVVTRGRRPCNPWKLNREKFGEGSSAKFSHYTVYSSAILTILHKFNCSIYM